MKVFLSHAAYDASVVQFLKSVLSSQLRVGTFLLPDDAPPGSSWMDQIRLGVQQSDELYSVVTPEFISRPWMSAEWACFWIQGKPTTPLLVGVEMKDLWGPMQASQGVSLASRSDVERLLRSIQAKTGFNADGGVWPLVDQIIAEVPHLRALQADGSVEQVVKLLNRNIRSGTDNIDPQVVDALVERNRIDEVLRISTTQDAASVKQRQVAVRLIDLDYVREAARIAEEIKNRSELRSVCTAIVKHMPHSATASSVEWQALSSLHDRLGSPQRRDVLRSLRTRNITPLGKWAA
ncbi:toll/interleukin-1 receptor domain-containing protein [Streptomyces sp. NPDC102395]|uniref:toll/interleukin-1 receptor domain-containing protein n=1 Tax=Streptomyces sp. NPDC102395 TaxID=3366168 RepID=UPI0038231029